MLSRIFWKNLNILAEYIESLKPTRKQMYEAFGFVLLALSIFSVLALYSYSPWDYLDAKYPFSKLFSTSVNNAAGFWGAKLSQIFFGLNGYVAFGIPLTLFVWGLTCIFGEGQMPTAKKLSAWFLMMMSSSTFMQIVGQRLKWFEPTFGFGGHFGRLFAKPLSQAAGFGGSIIVLTGLLIIFLVLSGNFVTRDALITWKYYTVKFLKLSFRFSIFSLQFSKKMIGLIFHDTPIAAVTDRWYVDPKAKKIKNITPASVSERKRLSSPKSSSKPVEVIAVLDEEEDEDSTKIESSLEFVYHGPSHGKPTGNLFSRSKPADGKNQARFAKLAHRLVHELASFKSDGKIISITEGPVVTTFEFEPAPGTKVSKIVGLSEDLARLLQTASVRIVAPIPGRNTIGFEIPNHDRRMIGFADLVESSVFNSDKYALPIAMGVDIFGHPIIQDLADMPHLLVAGSTGAGKSVFTNTLIASLIAKHSAKDLRLILIDPKMVELAAYNHLPHLACPVVTDTQGEAKQRLDELVVEMELRYRKMQAVGAKNIRGFNDIIKTKRKSEFPKFEEKWQAMPYIVLIVDELADMMMQLGKDAEIPITRLAQKARAAGIHLVIATQRPSADVVTGLIKANFPTRVAFRVLSGIDSRTILDQSGAETLLGKGDMLFLSSQGLLRLHGAYLSEAEVQAMVKVSSSKAR